ncbi:HNH endonuclease [Halomicrobium salinisoli]|uniref:HNH endonuclease n=1 Tax=Halomicrobium salinisoli TaxID=2878391 RepID=UPI001CEFFC88|nr:HNH endonuclease signature motif containing protein [Halomicrobium salinisoli]
MYTFWEDQNSTALLLGIGFLAIGVAPLAYAGYLARTEGWRSAWEFLVTTEAEAQSGSSSSDDTEKTPPPSENLKNTLIFDRADQQCEWCEESYDHLEVHHIEPRSEGGPNEPKNLIVLCPNCHENADREAIPRSKLRAKVERLPEINPT